MRLTPPVEDKGHAVLRAAVEGAASLLPVAGALARLYQTTHPSKFAVEVEQWQGDISATVNDLAERLGRLEAAYAPRIGLSDLAVEVAIWLLSDPNREPHHPVSQAQLAEGFGGRDPARVAEAAHELADAGLVGVTPVVGDGGDRVRALWPLIWLFEPLVSGVSPLADAAQLAEQALTDDLLEAQAVHDATGWSPRRINAAFALIETFAPRGHVGSPAHPVFRIYTIHILPETRRRLRAFIGAS